MDERKCKICWEIIVKTTILNPCSHIFCDDCIMQSIKKNTGTCPLCQTFIKSFIPSERDDLSIMRMIKCGDFEKSEVKIFLKRFPHKIDKEELKKIKTKYVLK